MHLSFRANNPVMLLVLKHNLSAREEPELEQAVKSERPREPINNNEDEECQTTGDVACPVPPKNIVLYSQRSKKPRYRFTNEDKEYVIGW